MILMYQKLLKNQSNSLCGIVKISARIMAFVLSLYCVFVLVIVLSLPVLMRLTSLRVGPIFESAVTSPIFDCLSRNARIRAVYTSWCGLYGKKQIVETIIVVRAVKHEAFYQRIPGEPALKMCCHHCFLREE